MAYSKKVVDKFENTINEPAKHNVGRFNPKDMDIGTGMVGAPACGDVMKLQIKCEQHGNTHVIKDVKFKTYGCGSAIASSSELVEMLLGKTLEEAKEIKNIDIVDALELPPIKIHCSVLAEDSIKQAIEDYEQKQ
jgi:nitrogen fixation NifU-like protein